MASAELSATKSLLRFAEEAISIMHNQDLSQGTQFAEVEAARSAAREAQAAVESSIQSLTVSELALRGEVEQVYCQVEELLGEVVGIRQDCEKSR